MIKAGWILSVVFILALARGGWAADADKLFVELMKLPAPERMKKLVEGARKEGSLVFYSPDREDLTNLRIKYFTDMYPGVVQKFVTPRVRNDIMIDRLLTEARAGKHQADVVWLQFHLVSSLQKEKRLAKYVAVEDAALPDGLKVDGQWRSLGNRLFHIMYNTKLLSEKEAPQTWEDLLDPRFDGHILMTDPSLIIPWLTTYKLWQDKLAPGFLTKLAAQHPTFVSSSNPGAQQIAAGEKWINVPSSPRALVAVLAAGAPIGYVVPKPTTIQESTQAISTAAKHPNAARLFMDYTLSPEGQQQLNKVTAISVLPNIPGTLALPEVYFLPDAVGAQRQKTQLLAPFGR